MPRKAEELGALHVAAITTPGLHAVGGVAGLCLQVEPTGGRSWVLRVMIAGKRRFMGLGGFPDVKLADARRLAREAREAISRGADPIDERRAAKARLLAEAGRLLTFEQATKDYLAAHEAEWTGKANRRQWFYMLEKLAVPVIGKMAVGDIETTHALALLRPLWADKTETAQRLRAKCEAVLNAAKASGAIRGPWENPFRWRGHLAGLLARPSKVAPVVHHKALPIAEASGFMAALRPRKGSAARALEWLILTACRSGEARDARWSEVDLAAKVWTIPAKRMKAGKEHRVPLSDAAVSLLNALPRVAGSDLLFPSPTGKALSDVVVSKLCGELSGGRAVPHGWRSTFRDWSADATSHPRDLCEAALAHVVGGTEGAYRRGDAVERRRPLMADWAKFVAKPPAKPAEGGGNVRHLRAMA
jgi:integrase